MEYVSDTPIRQQSGQKNPREQLLAEMPATERRLRIGGVSTVVLEGGKGAPIVLLHGPGEYAAKWFRIFPDLATTHRVIAPNLPGHGETETVDGPIDVARVIAWLDELIDRTCSIPPLLVGQIIGGAVAARYAVEHGDKLSRLVLSDTLGLVDFQPAPEFGAALVAFNTSPSEETHDRLWNACAYDLDTLRTRLGYRWDSFRAYNLEMAGVHSTTQRRLFELFAQHAIPDLDRIATPTTLIWGRHDLATPLSAARTAARKYGWPLHVIDDAADDPAIEQPEAFVTCLRAILDPDVSSWDRIAAGYDRTNTETQMRLADEGLQRAKLEPGMSFLDVAAGSGALSIPAARRGADVLATDASPAMLELLRVRAQQENLNVETRVMDGHVLELEDDRFDRAGSQFGVMLFTDMPTAIREMVRVTKPGGRVLVHAYGDPHAIDFLGFFIAAIRTVRPHFEGPPSDPPPPEFQLADPERLRTVLVGAGLRDIEVETVTERTDFSGGDALWEWVISSNPLPGRLLDMLELTSEERSAVREALDALVRERAAGSHVATLTNPVHIGIGTKR